MSSSPSLSSLHDLTASNRQARIVPEQQPMLGRRAVDGRFIQILVGVARAPRRRRTASQSTVTQAVPGREGEVGGHGSAPKHAAARNDPAGSAHAAGWRPVRAAWGLGDDLLRADDHRLAYLRAVWQEFDRKAGGANRCVVAQARATSRSTALSRRPIRAPLSPTGPRSSRVFEAAGIEILRGRDSNDADQPDTQPVVIIRGGDGPALPDRQRRLWAVGTAARRRSPARRSGCWR